MKLGNIKKEFFTLHLLKWNAEKNMRQMPWKGEKDPYKIWLSEIILQQTRVEQGWDYYNRFVAAFPTIQQLVKAPETKVFKMWEGLGYYTRCRNLIATAKLIAKNYDGIFPNKYDEILKLKGVGPYTAAAIASFAFNQPHAVIDGNVYRVLARFFGIETASNSTTGKHFFNTLANELLDKKTPGIYNQAIMDFGATVCKPQLPGCKNCPLKKQCSALATNKVGQLPVKGKKITVKIRWFYYFIFIHKNTVQVRQRGKGDIWESLYEFVLHEHSSELSVKKIRELTFLKKLTVKEFIISAPAKQLLSHQLIKGRFIIVHTEKKVDITDYSTVPLKKLKQLPFPKYITGFLNEKNVSLSLY